MLFSFTSRSGSMSYSLWRFICQISRVCQSSSGGYSRMIFMRERKASSKLPTRLIVRKRMPTSVPGSVEASSLDLQYSRVRRNTMLGLCQQVFATSMNFVVSEMIDPPETRALRARSVSALSARKTSASSNRSTQPHLCASRKQVFNLCSTLSPVLPISPTVILNSGHFVSFATHSVVDVLPTPGAPRSRIMRPFSRVSNFHV